MDRLCQSSKKARPHVMTVVLFTSSVLLVSRRIHKCKELHKFCRSRGSADKALEMAAALVIECAGQRALPKAKLDITSAAAQHVLTKRCKAATTGDEFTSHVLLVRSCLARYSEPAWLLLGAHRSAGQCGLVRSEWLSVGAHCSAGQARDAMRLELQAWALVLRTDYGTRQGP